MDRHWWICITKAGIFSHDADCSFHSQTAQCYLKTLYGHVDKVKHLFIQSKLPGKNFMTISYKKNPQKLSQYQHFCFFSFIYFRSFYPRRENELRLRYQEAEVVDPDPGVVPVDTASPGRLVHLLHRSDGNVGHCRVCQSEGDTDPLQTTRDERRKRQLRSKSRLSLKNRERDISEEFLFPLISKPKGIQKKKTFLILRR